MRPIQVHKESATLSAAEAMVALGMALGRAPQARRSHWEAALQGAFGGPAVAVASGRGAIALALEASDIRQPKNEVIVTGFTCVAVPAGVIGGGGIPRYADIDDQTGNLTASSVAQATTGRV